MLDEDGAELPGVPIPRAALWSFFEDLAEAACSMAYGCNPLDGNSVHEHWQPIIHRDLKPENVFLALPVKDIPVLRLGDFGIAVPEKYEALSNPMGMLGAGTKGWRAPEQALSSGGIEPIFPLSSATNVWSIGRIMLALVELYPRNPPEIDYSQPQKGRVERSPKEDELREFYGTKLLDLIDMCIESRADYRITAEDLLEQVRKYRKAALPHPGDNVELEYAGDYCRAEGCAVLDG